MIKLKRSKNHRWIFQKNVSSAKIINGFIDVLSSVKDTEDKALIKRQMRSRCLYKGRSHAGSLNTMGVRFSQMCFYMFGYKKTNSSGVKVFMPSQTTINALSKENNEVAKNMLVNLFSMQFPHPNSKTDCAFSIRFGRLIVKLLTEEKINKRLYIDEFIWFLPFIESINQDSYLELVDSICEYRKYSYEKKKKLFQTVYNFDDVFSNCLHECKYYFMKIYNSFNVFNFVADPSHNSGNLFRFRHGSSTLRNDSVNRKDPGFIKLDDSLIESACKLLSNYCFFEAPTTMTDLDICSKQDWYTQLYDIEPLGYLSTIFKSYALRKDISTKINRIQHDALYGSVDGKDFETSLEKAFPLFDKEVKTELISGSGYTDVLVSVEGSYFTNGDIYKVNVEGKSRSSINSFNPCRQREHLKKHGAKYCIVVSPKIPPKAIRDIEGFNIVLLRSDVLVRYLSKECLNENAFEARYEPIEKIIYNNMGDNISDKVDRLIDKEYGIQL